MHTPEQEKALQRETLGRMLRELKWHMRRVGKCKYRSVYVTRFTSKTIFDGSYDECYRYLTDDEYFLNHPKNREMDQYLRSLPCRYPNCPAGPSKYNPTPARCYGCEDHDDV